MVVGYTPCLVAIFPGLLSIAQEISAQVREICHPEGGHSATGRWSRWLLDGGWGGALTFCWNQLFCNIYIYLHHIYSSSHIYNIYIYGKQTTKLRWQTHVSSRFGMMIPNCWMFFTTNELMDNYWRSVENHHWTDPQTTSYFGCVNHVLLGSTKPVDPYPNQPFRSHISIFLGKNLQVIGCVEQLYLVFHFESKSP
jgi:hypothetical protein